MEIIDNCQNPRWTNIPCCCDHSSVLTEYPMKDCIHCKCEEAEGSIPKNDFTVKDIDGNNVNINKINVIRGNKLQDCIGWTF